jgi:hypothetical protein
MTKMGTSIKRTAKIATVLSVVFLSSALADALPTAEDINSLAENAKLTTDTFMQQSFRLRMQYEFSGRFLTDDDKENLYKLAQSAVDKLRAVVEKQETLKHQIEDYKGDDWDARYGSTGLWRKLSADIYTTKFSKFEIDYYLALASEQPQRDKILHLILGEIDSLGQSGRRFGPNLTRGRVLAQLAQTEPSYKDAAVGEFEAFDIYSDIYLPTAAAIEKMKLLGRADTNQLNILVKTLRSNWNGSYLELILSLMVLQRQYDSEGFEKTVSLWPQTKDFIGSLILADLANRISQRQTIEENLEQISVFEAELAVQAAWKDETKKYQKLLSCFANTEKFQTPLILYAAAAKLTESSPTKAVNLLIKVSRLQQQQKSDKLNIESYKIAEQAAQLAYSLFAKDPCNCSVAIDAFDNYFTIAAGRIDEELEYLYSSILRNCGRVEESKRLLQEIADSSANPWNRRAKLDLILQQMHQNHEQQTSQDELLEQLGGFILNCPGRDNNDSAICAEALNIYCRSLLERADASSAQKVLDILSEAEVVRGVKLDYFRAKAFQQIGELEQAVHYMVSAIIFDSGSLAPEAALLLSEVVERIEQFETQAEDFDKMLNDCIELAEFSNKSLDSRQTALLFVEFLVFTADDEQGRLMKAENLLNTLAEETYSGDVDFVRCRARLLTEQGKFEAAAELWVKLCEMRKDELPLTNQRSWKWWRAKYYELYCWSKLPQTRKAAVVHSIEILENSFHNIPPLWAEKLGLLKGSAAAG